MVFSNLFFFFNYIVAFYITIFIKINLKNFVSPFASLILRKFVDFREIFSFR